MDHIVFQVTQNEQTGAIALNSGISNPLILLDIITVVQRQLVQDALTHIEVKKKEPKSDLILN